MSINAFISYSHADEKALERLHKHMAMLRRDETLQTWTDHKILPGDKLSNQIDQNLEKSKLFLGLLSPDYLASHYCYENEFEHARTLASQGKIRIIPVILEPCDWMSSPFREYLAVPKDGKALSEWANQNNAYLDIVASLRRVIKEGIVTTGKLQSNDVRRSPNRQIRAKQDFDTIQKGEFADEAFKVIEEYFKNSCDEMNDIGEGNLKAKFEKMDTTAFTCTVVNRGKRREGEASITVRNRKGRRNSFGDINFVFDRFADSNTSNGSISVEADDYNMFLSVDSYSGADKTNLSSGQAAEILWLEFTKQAGIEYG